ncbi:hypothetical protein BY996DRAFT_7240297 [Phakopsora pachyrhizi]|nr:hypothetical protein BY996DRAFT_7240297 [Phakopsora pachyrhizi]
MESVLERVETVERIDWSVLDHGRLELYNPIHKQGNLGSSDQDQDLCSFHSKVQPINSTNVTTTMLEGISSNSSSKRSLDMVAELTEELENIRSEIKLELREKNQEIERLRSSLTVREVEIDRLMGRLSHFMGIEGFYIHRNHTLDDTHLDLDLNLTPRAKSKREDASINQESLPTMTRVGVWSELRRKEGGYGIDCRELEREIQELENILNEDYGYEVPTKFEDSHQAEDRSGSTGSSDSCNSGGEVDLRVKYKKIIKERDRLRSQLQRPLSSHEEENLIKTLRRQLSQLKSENSRVNELLKSSEARVQELERRLAGQEVEFEGLAQRVQEKLKEQRNKILEAKTRIEELESEREMNHEKLDLRTDSDSKKSDAEGDSQSENNSGDHK